MSYDRNDRNDQGNGKSCMKEIGRGVQISYHLCRGGVLGLVWVNGGKGVGIKESV